MPIIITNEEVRNAIGKDLETIAGKLPADKEFVLVPKEDHIPKSRFDEVNATVKDYKAQLADRDKQLNDLAPKVKGNEELAKTVEELRKLNTETVNKYESQILERDRNYALNETLRVYKPRNLKAVTALLDHTKIEFRDGQLKGAKEQLEELRKTDGYLFENDEGGGGIIAGRQVGGTGGGKTELEQTLERAFGLNKPKK